MDDVDRAAQREEELRQDALAKQAKKAPRGKSALFCHECGERIPRARRFAVPGVKTCIDCQGDIERRKAT
jgi:phage/conjugal plasmid C-4 type zinc finger TraR family protein